MESLNDRYGLGKNVLLEYIGPNHIAIVKFTKRRLVEADAQQFIETAQRIKEKDPEVEVSLLCSDNICSKLVKKLSDAKIDVLLGEPDAD